MIKSNNDQTIIIMRDNLCPAATLTPVCMKLSISTGINLNWDIVNAPDNLGTCFPCWNSKVRLTQDNKIGTSTKYTQDSQCIDRYWELEHRMSCVRSCSLQSILTTGLMFRFATRGRQQPWLYFPVCGCADTDMDMGIMPRLHPARTHLLIVHGLWFLRH